MYRTMLDVVRHAREVAHAQIPTQERPQPC